MTPAAPSASVRHRVRTADGACRWYETSATARFDAAGRVTATYSSSRDIDDRVTLEAALAASELRLRRALDAGPDGCAIYRVETDDEGQVTGLVLLWINLAGAAGYQRDQASLVGRDVRDFYPDAVGTGLWLDLVTAFHAGIPQLRRLAVGTQGMVLDTVQVRLDATTVMSTWRDVTDQLRGEELLTQAYEETAEVRATLQTALEATSDGFVVFELERDAAGGVLGMHAVHANAAATAGVGRGAEQVLGRDPRHDYPLYQDDEMWDKTLAAITQRCPRQHRMHEVDALGELTRSIDATIAPIGADRVVLTFRDVTLDERALREHEGMRRRAEHAAIHDPLTGLPNRVLLRRRLTEALETCEPGERVGVIFCDLDDFKVVNDTYGHAAGDAVLKATAKRLANLVRRGDTAARLSGDEFVLLLQHIPANWKSADFLARAAQRLAEPVWVEGALLAPSASLGAVMADPRGGPDGDRDVEALMVAADLAMYAAKGTGRPAVE